MQSSKDDILWRWIRPLISLSVGSTVWIGLLILLNRSGQKDPLSPAEAELQVRITQIELLLGTTVMTLGASLTMLWDLAVACRPKRLAQCFAGIHLILAVLPAWQAATFRAWPYGLALGLVWITFQSAMALGFFLCVRHASDLEEPEADVEAGGLLRLSWLQAPGVAAREERRRLARDLHDSIKQQIFSVKMSAAAAEARWEDDPAGARSSLADIRRSAQAAMVEMQALLGQLRPEAVVMDGFVEALREQAEALGYRSGAHVHFELGELPPESRLSPWFREQLFRIAQEALSNIARHARANNVDVWLGMTETPEGAFIVLRVRDDGQGFDPTAEASGMGLRNIQERVGALQGRLALESSPGSGTELRVYVALQARAEGSRRRLWQGFGGRFPTLLSLFCIILVLYSPFLSGLALGILVLDMLVIRGRNMAASTNLRLTKSIYLMLFSWWNLLIWSHQSGLNSAFVGGLIALPLALTLWVAWSFLAQIRDDGSLSLPSRVTNIVLALVLLGSTLGMLYDLIQGEGVLGSRIALAGAIFFYGGWSYMNWRKASAKP